MSETILHDDGTYERHLSPLSCEKELREFMAGTYKGDEEWHEGLRKSGLGKAIAEQIHELDAEIAKYRQESMGKGTTEYSIQHESDKEKHRVQFLGRSGMTDEQALEYFRFALGVNGDAEWLKELAALDPAGWKVIAKSDY